MSTQPHGFHYVLRNLKKVTSTPDEPLRFFRAAQGATSAASLPTHTGGSNTQCELAEKGRDSSSSYAEERLKKRSELPMPSLHEDCIEFPRDADLTFASADISLLAKINNFKGTGSALQSCSGMRVSAVCEGM
jgi:hypothetical protein